MSSRRSEDPETLLGHFKELRDEMGVQDQHAYGCQLTVATVHNNIPCTPVRHAGPALLGLYISISTFCNTHTQQKRTRTLQSRKWVHMFPDPLSASWRLKAAL